MSREAWPTAGKLLKGHIASGLIRADDKIRGVMLEFDVFGEGGTKINIKVN